MCEPRNRDNGANDLWTLTAYCFVLVGVLVAGTTLEITGENSVIEGEFDNTLILRVNLTIDPDSSTLMNVTDAWSIEVFGNTLENGLGSDGTGRDYC